MKKIGTLLVLIFCLNANAQTWVTIPDANFVTYLQINLSSAMSGNQMNITSAAVTTTQTLVIAQQGVLNLTGIQYFTSLTYLACYNNGLTYLPVLPNSLTYLDCDNNKLTSLPALPNSLIWVDCTANKLLNIPTLSSNMTNLYCSNNYLTSLPTLPNSLAVLYCNNDSLTSLPTLGTSLTSLQCYSNKITCFPTFPNSITSLHIGANPYNCLPNYISSMDSSFFTTPLCAAGNSNGCAIATGINQITDLNNQVNIYPNPTNNNFTIETNSTEKQTLQLFDVNGKLVLTQTINGKTNIDGSNLAEGVYNLSLTNYNGVVNKRLVIIR